jgi:phosphoribosylamine--glycine ligase
MNGDKRKFLFVSITGLISDIAWQVAKEGHEVRYCIEDEKERDIADGFVPKVRDWQREVDWADVIVFDDTLGQGEKAQALRRLQRHVTGVEVAVGAFFNGKEFIYPLNVNFEHKKLFPGNIGPSTGEMGTAMFWSGPNKLFNSTLKKMEAKLASEGYVGYIDLNCIVNGNGIYPLEFTARFGYPTISIQQEGMTTPIGQFLADLAAGANPKLKVKSGFQIGVRVVVSPFPFDDDATFLSVSKHAAILFKKGIPEEVHIEDVMQVNGQWYVAGTSGVVLVVCGVGQTMRQAQAQAYSRIRNIMIPDMYYRDDIGERWFEDHDKLHTWGYLREI